MKLPPASKTLSGLAVLALFAVAVGLAHRPRPSDVLVSPAASSPVAIRAQGETVAIRRVLPELPAPVSDWRTYTPDTVTIAPLPGLSMPFHAVRVTREGEITTWVGRNGLRGASLVAIGKRDRWDAVLTMIGGSFDVHVHGNDARVIEHTEPFMCPGAVPAAQPGENAKALIHASAGAAPAAIPVTGDPAVHASGTTIYTVEVSFFYDKTAEEAATPLAGSLADVPSFMDSKYRAYLETNNLILEQSQVPNLRWHFAGIYRAPNYTPEHWDFGGDNGAERFNTTADLQYFENPQHELGAFAASKNATVWADMSVLIVTRRDVSGLALFGGHYCVVDFVSRSTALAHEMGHNFGLYHDRRTEAADDENDGAYNYGYVFDYHFSWFGGIDYQNGVNPNTFGDVMAYSVALPYFSNPNVFVTGNDFAAGYITQPDPNRYPLGVDAGKKGGAFAARTLWEGAAAMAAFRNDPSQTFPVVSVQPIAALALGTGAQLRLSVQAAGTNLSYQWRRNGSAIPGATNAAYTKGNATAADTGAYDVVITNNLGSVITRAASVIVSNEATTSRLVNISTRSQVGTGDDVQIAGFVISGNAPKTVLVRAGSAVLTAAGLHGVLADPLIELHDRSSTITSNDDWSADPVKADAIRSAAVQVGAAAWTDGTRDAAILITLNPGLYTAVVKGKNGGTGMAIVEVYEVDQAASRVVNISTRSQVGTGDDVQIAGFVISGNAPKTVLIRAGSAVLTAAGLSGVLADPLVELHDRTSTITSNDDWSADPVKADAIRSAAVQVGAAAWATGTRDAAILITLNPGAYTALVKGKNDTAGMAIVEVYEVTP